MSSSRSFRLLDQVMAWFVVILVTSNIASAAKIVDLGFSIAGFRLAFDGGTILFPLSYIIGDILTEVYGFRQSRKVIWTGFAALAVSAGVFALLRALPGEAGWEGYAGSAAYDAILGGVSSGGIVLASLVAYFCGEFANSAVLSRLKIRTEGRFLWLRTMGSTIVGQALDTLVFIGVATLAGVFTKDLFITLVVSNYLFKCAVEFLFTPLTYFVVKKLKQVEGIDNFDRGVRLNPFAFKD